MSVQSMGVRFIKLIGATAALASCAALVTTGCGLDSGGLGDLFVSAGDDGGTSLDATFVQTGDGSVNGGGDTGDGNGSGDDATTGAGDSSSGSDDGGGADTSPPVDTGTDTCASNLEICNNGIDDNCNGKVDCADTACGPAAWQCTHQTVPAGWTVVEYASSPTAAACGTGYATASSVYEQPFGNATCSCTCSVAEPGSCEIGSFTYVIDNNNNCGGLSGLDPAGGGTCQSIPIPGYTPGGGAKQKVTPLGYTAAGPAASACTSTASTTKPTIPENGHVCAESTAAGAGCANNGACVPAVQAGYALCIQQESADGGQIPCPNGFSNVHNVGSGVTDNRSCTACNCTGPTATCGNEQVTLFTDPQCGDGGTGSVKVDGNCDNVDTFGGGANPTFHAYEYSAKVVGEACGGSGSSTPTGGVALTGLATICCQ